MLAAAIFMVVRV